MVAATRFGRGQARYDDDLAPQLVSWTIAFAIGGAWLALVYSTPLPVVSPALVRLPNPVVDFRPGLSAARSLSATARPTSEGTPLVRPRARGSSSALDAAELFAAAVAQRTIANVSDLMKGAIAVPSAPAGNSRAAKSALGENESSATPGMAPFNRAIEGGKGTAGVGQVESAAGITRAAVHVKPLPVVSAPPLGAPTADAAEVGSFVRMRVSQLQTCYERNGGTDLAGVVALRLTIGDAGGVRSAEIVRRSWSGPAAAATETCLLDLVRGWRMPTAPAGATMTIPISFTRGA